MKTSCHNLVSHARSCAVLIGTLLSWAAGTERIEAQPNPVPRPDVWRPDGPVLAMAIDRDAAYVGGSFG